MTTRRSLIAGLTLALRNRCRIKRENLVMLHEFHTLRFGMMTEQSAALITSEKIGFIPNPQVLTIVLDIFVMPDPASLYIDILPPARHPSLWIRHHCKPEYCSGLCKLKLLQD